MPIHYRGGRLADRAGQAERKASRSNPRRTMGATQMQAAILLTLAVGVIQPTQVEPTTTPSPSTVGAEQHHGAIRQGPIIYPPAAEAHRPYGVINSTLGSIWPLPNMKYSSRFGFRPEKRWNPHRADGYYFPRTFDYRVELDYPWHSPPRTYGKYVLPSSMTRGGMPASQSH